MEAKKPFNKKGNVITMTLKGKQTSYGYVEIRTVGGGWFGLFIDGDFKEQSADRSFIEREYDRY